MIAKESEHSIEFLGTSNKMERGAMSLSPSSAKRVGTGKDYDVAETIVVPDPQAAENPKKSRGSRAHRDRSEKSRDTPSVVDANDPKEVVKKFWHGSFSESRNRKLLPTKSKLRQQMLLTEELQQLQKGSMVWGDYSELSGKYWRNYRIIAPQEIQARGCGTLMYTNNNYVFIIMAGGRKWRLI
jgi:hypothetical protein